MTNICVNENSKFYFDFFLSVSYSISSWSAFPLSEAFDKGDEKSVLYMYCPSAFSGVLVWTIGESEKTTEYVALSNENALVWAGGKFENAILVEKLFCFVFVKMKTGTSENILVWSGLYTRLESRGAPRLVYIVLISSQFLCFILNPTKPFFLEISQAFKYQLSG